MKKIAITLGTLALVAAGSVSAAAPASAVTVPKCKGLTCTVVKECTGFYYVSQIQGSALKTSATVRITYSWGKQTTVTRTTPLSYTPYYYVKGQWKQMSATQKTNNVTMTVTRDKNNYTGKAKIKMNSTGKLSVFCDVFF